MLFELKTPKQRAALACLQPITGVSRASFDQSVISLLSVIHSPDAYYRTNEKSPAQTVRELKRWARGAQRFADGLEDQKWSSVRSPFTVLPDPPISALRDYAAQLLDRAVAVQKSHKVGADRHGTHQQTIDILFLFRLIEQTTGKPNWDAVTTLIQAATGDVGFSRDRLRKLVKYQEKKYYALKRDQKSSTLGSVPTR